MPIIWHGYYSGVFFLILFYYEPDFYLYAGLMFYGLLDIKVGVIYIISPPFFHFLLMFISLRFFFLNSFIIAIILLYYVIIIYLLY